MRRHPEYGMAPSGKQGWMFCIALLLAVGLSLSGCRYTHNRMADFRDMFQAGAGITAVNRESGPVPPALGVNFHMTDLVGNLGYSTFYGYAAEMDGRGFYAGFEERSMGGFPFIYQTERIAQHYDTGMENYFKQDNSWAKQMRTKESWNSLPAKDLMYEKPSEGARTRGWGVPGGLFHRGWNHWENLSGEFSLCDPLLTKVGFNLRLGLDLSEAGDFFLGLLMIDLYHDDLVDVAYKEYAGKRGPKGMVATQPQASRESRVQEILERQKAIEKKER